MEKEILKEFKRMLEDFMSELQNKMENQLNQLNINKKESIKDHREDIMSFDLRLFDFTELQITKDEFIADFKKVLKRSQHRAMIIVPTIQNIKDLEVYNVRSGVYLSIACSIEIAVEENEQLYEELKSLGNLDIRNYEERDRWVFLRDGEELLCALVGTHEDNYLVFHTTDSAHIKILSNLATDAWLKSRRI